VTRADWAEYLDSATELDRKIELVLKQLEADGMMDNTVIFFFGDNGQSHVRGKQFVYEEGLHVPLIVHWPKNFHMPKNFKAGTVSSQLIESIDFAPTSLAIAGTAKPAKMFGRVFLGDRSEPPREYAFGARDRCDETVFRLRSVRDARYRYIRNFTPDRPFLQKNDYKERSYPVWNLLKDLHAQGKLTSAQELLCQPTMPPEELYDLETDPHEISNLIASANPAHQAALKRLRSALEKWLADTDDQGRFFEPQEVVERKGATKDVPKAGTKPDKEEKKRDP
jgi:arylsulfatase A-like enzyme